MISNIFGTTSCESPTPVGPTEVVVNINNPKTTETQKEMLKMFDMLGILPATLFQKQAIEKDGIIEKMSYYDAWGVISYDLTLNKEMTSENEGKVVYDVVKEDGGVTKRHERQIFEKTAEGMLRTVERPVGLAPGGTPGADTEWKVNRQDRLIEKNGMVYEVNKIGITKYIYSKDTKNSLNILDGNGDFLGKIENINVDLR